MYPICDGHNDVAARKRQQICSECSCNPPHNAELLECDGVVYSPVATATATYMDDVLRSSSSDGLMD
ncbi:unnamed protein product [Arabis nemorensis]|uniref:Uncharacterized protein n=1 Tax=Arabis nemorensis TaxID=586526 RepID=A0A565C804_9BRAS|nr:unnamed protein product [Arabis nemorensis]